MQLGAVCSIYHENTENQISVDNDIFFTQPGRRVGMGRHIDILHS